MVHWKLSYETPIEAVKHRDGLGVLGVVFNASAAFKNFPWIQVSKIMLLTKMIKNNLE